jgi:hypothetical protein
MEKNYVIWDSVSGAYDGAYASLNSAQASLTSMKERHPSRYWCIVQIIESPESKCLADDTFHNRILWDKEVNEETGETVFWKLDGGKTIYKERKVN